MRSRVQIHLEDQLAELGVDVILPSLVACAAFSEIFACGGGLASMAVDPNINTTGNIENARENARQFMEAVYDRLTNTK